MAVVYEVFYIVRFVFGFNKFIEFFVDITYALLLGLGFFTAIYIANGAKTEFFHILGYFSGLLAIDIPLRFLMRKLGIKTLAFLKKFKAFNKLIAMIKK